MEPLKKYVTCKVAFYVSFTQVTLCQFYSFTSAVLFTKNNKLWNERKNHLLYLWLLQRITLYPKVENRLFRHNCIFRHRCMYKQPMLTK